MTVYSVLIKKCDKTIDVDASRFNHSVHEHIFEYGLRQKLNDSISTFKAGESDMDEAYGVVESVVERLYGGDIRAHRVGATQTADGIARKLALTKVCNVWLKKNKGKALKEYATRDADANKELETNKAKYLAVAEAQLELMKEESPEV